MPTKNRTIHDIKKSHFLVVIEIVVAFVVYIPLYCGPPPPSGGTQVITA